MAKRTKTKYTSIYYNEDTQLYDVKYNYKEYDTTTGRNKYKAKWVYSVPTLAEARKTLADLQVRGIKREDKDVTLAGMYEIWENQHIAVSGGSPVTVNNTQCYLRMLSQFISLDTKLKDITEDTYIDLCAKLRRHGYSDETLHNLNATFRKLINLAYKKKLIRENILDFADNMRTKQKDSDSYRLITRDEFKMLDVYFKTNRYMKLGIDVYKQYRVIINLLYYSGCRIGELLALTYNDFEKFSYYKADDEPIRLVPSSTDTERSHLIGLRMHITKAYVSDIKLTKCPKNLKKRAIPLPADAERLVARYIEQHRVDGGDMSERMFQLEHGAVAYMLKSACEKLDIDQINCHAFRHTYISNLFKQNVPLPVIEKVSGDTQETLLKRYSHMWEQDEVLVLRALQKI